MYHQKQLSLNLSSFKTSLDVLTENFTTISGTNEIRCITEVNLNTDFLKDILKTKNWKHKKISFNLMMITNDHKVFLLERSESFHYPKVKKDLKCNKIYFKYLNSLYTSEKEEIRELYFDFLSPEIAPSQTVPDNMVYIFPGGHSLYGETTVSTLIRELQEETSMNLYLGDLKFHPTCIFKVLIYDLLVSKTFNNLVFPVKVHMTSNELIKNFQATKHTRNPTFVDIKECKTLFDAVLKVQKFMLL
jgi:8-oxo-dGTP pyrophosphatase MutT (NUDIX family)